MLMSVQRWDAAKGGSAGRKPHGWSSRFNRPPFRGFLFEDYVKRFTDTNIWDRLWFRRVAPRVKELFRYLYERCDPAGVIDPDWDLMSFMIGEKVTPKDLEALNGNVIERDGKLYLPQFIEFQYGKLSKDCPPHHKVFEAIAKHGITLDATLCPSVPARAQEEEEEEEEDKDKDRGSVRGRFTKPTLEAMKLHGAKIGLPDDQTERCFAYYESNGWKVGKNPMRSWQFAMVNWRKGWEERGRPMAGTTTQATLSPGMDAMVTQKELERIEEKLRTLNHSYSEHQTWDALDIERRKMYREKQRTLRIKLGLTP